MYKFILWIYDWFIWGLTLWLHAWKASIPHETNNLFSVFFFFFNLFYFFLNKGQIRHIDVHCTLLFLDVSIYPAYHDKNHKFWHYYMVIDERHSAKIEIFRCGLDWTYLTSTSYVYVLTLFFFFFPCCCARFLGDNSYCSWTVAIVYWLFNPLLSILWIPWTVHETHKLHFSVTFSLKMGPTTLFTHLKIILLQYFQFQQNKFYPNKPLIW